MECRVRGIHQLSCCRQSTRSTDGLAGVSVRRLAAQMDTNVVRILQQGFRVFFGVSQFCGSCRGRRRCSRDGRPAHGVSGLSGVRGGPCEVAFLFSANFLSAVSFQLLFVKKKIRPISTSAIFWMLNFGTTKGGPRRVEAQTNKKLGPEGWAEGWRPPKI